VFSACGIMSPVGGLECGGKDYVFGVKDVALLRMGKELLETC